MKIVALKERAKLEARTAITPEVAKLYIKKGHVILVEKDIGDRAGFADQLYIDAGAQISAVALEILADADIILKVQPSPLSAEINEIDYARSGAIILGMLSPHANFDYLKKMTAKGACGIAMELVPRITRAQNMDVLSSQSNLAGYRAVLEAAYNFDRIFPMMMTAAGTISPAKVLILGVGVAGLQAIATAKRLGAAVFAYDVRSITREQVESLGAKFIAPEIVVSDMEDKSGYAKERSEADKVGQEQFLASVIRNYDIIITTAQIPGKPAPRLITSEMLDLIKPGSVIVDMATASGGNVEGSKLDEVMIRKGVKIIGWSNLAGKIAADSSKLYAKNLYNFLEHAIKDGKFDFDDEIVKQMLVRG
ncbi:NAD(P) transhydrogenase subunit alpha [Candidatus Trichorickettsia mobilis]|uniref:NAD(P) transhydrogenase subunit alpha n=1 Tax=Candidatus Trichorickettsia mobilis TaxID=1346319 RepID=UPI0029305D45|nr:NAD(P) transhydrogenase subunit alpha [Candidatus Trichorickettsia mobilis]